MTEYALTGIDANDPTPGTLREIQLAQGDSGSGGRERSVLIIGNMATGTGTGSVDGLGEALNTPRLITSRQDVVDRAGYRSEALALYDAFCRINGSITVYLALVPAGSGAATCTFTFATASDRAGAIKISCMGEDVEVAVANGDAVADVATAVAAKINAQLGWCVTASAALGVVTVTASFAGVRGTHYVDKMRVAFKRPNAMTVTKSAVTAGSTEDDQTALLSTLESWEIFYHVNPKGPTSSTTSSDNGIGEHAAHIRTQTLPINGKGQVVFFGCVGTISQATAVAVSVNTEWAFCVWAEDSDYSPGMIAAQVCAAQSMLEAGDRAASMVGYGPGGVGGELSIPDPFDPGDRPTRTEIKTALNNGVTPVAFRADGKPYVVWVVTTRSETNSTKDYRARAGHIPSVVHDFWETVRIRYESTKQDRVAADPGEGEKPLPGFTYPRDVTALIRKVIDDKIDGQLATLDPAQREAMKASVDTGLIGSGKGTSARAQIVAVKHNLKGHFLIQETGPEI